jgi:hypothetical protein
MKGGEDMCCGTESYHGWPWDHHHGACCACGEPVHHEPRFLTKEKTAWLERYLESLREQVKAVEGHIVGMKEEG